MSWIRFHSELRQGAKRGIPRALRFVYLEISHEAYAKAGYVVLPSGMEDVDAVHDILGGNRKEVKDAIDTFTGGDEPMLRFETVGVERRLYVTKWEKWNPKRDNSTDRVRKLREKREQERNALHETNGNALHGVTGTPGNGEGTEPRARARLSPSVSFSDLSGEGLGGEGVAREPGPEFDRQANGVRNATADGAFGAAVAAWADGIRQVTGEPCVVARGGPVQVLAESLRAHCPDDSQRVSWARQKAVEYAECQRKAGQKIKPHDFADWLNSGCPDVPSGVRRIGGIGVQPGRPDGKRAWEPGDGT